MSIYSSDQVQAIAAQHGLSGRPVLMPNMGMENEVWRLGEYVLRLPLRESGEKSAYVEAVLVPCAMRAGVRTPDLIAFDTSLSVIPKPFTIFRRAAGVPLGTTDATFEQAVPLLHDLAAQVLTLHGARVEIVAGTTRASSRSDVEQLLERAARLGKVDPVDVPSFEQWIEALAPAFDADFDADLIHNDLHPWNLLVDPDTMRLTAILDWGDGGIGDPALDLCGFPFRETIALVAAYRELGAAPDDTLEGRLLCEWLTVGLWEMLNLDDALYRRRWWRMPSTKWGYISREFENADGRWRQWLP